MSILFATSEVYPLIKTGGLADVSSSLPLALNSMGEDVRVIVPAYRTITQSGAELTEVAQTSHYGFAVHLLETFLPDSSAKVYVVDCPDLYDRPGNPYVDSTGSEWSDNPLRFALFSQVVVDVALNRIGLNWAVDIVHCNDWQTGLVPALLSLQESAPASIFTVHNLAYQGVYERKVFFDLGLPAELFNWKGVEYYGYFSFIKGGLSFADKLTTVSKTYAEEVKTAEFAYGLEGLFQARSADFIGILNGIDTAVWNPADDHFLPHHFQGSDLSGKKANKSFLQQHLGLPQKPDIPIFGLISRLVEQKGLELIIEALPELLSQDIQCVFLGSGESRFETALTDFSNRYPEKVSVTLGYDEALSHQIEAGCDFYLMPSLFEPCGLNQMYSLAYGTIPIVTQVGGLADSVVDANEENLQTRQANGIVMSKKTTRALLDAVLRSIALFNQGEPYLQLQNTAMSGDFSWQKSAVLYLDVYRLAIAQR